MYGLIAILLIALGLFLEVFFFLSFFVLLWFDYIFFEILLVDNVNFCWTTKWLSYIYIFFHYGLS